MFTLDAVMFNIQSIKNTLFNKLVLLSIIDFVKLPLRLGEGHSDLCPCPFKIKQIEAEIFELLTTNPTNTDPADLYKHSFSWINKFIITSDPDI